MTDHTQPIRMSQWVLGPAIVAMMSGCGGGGSGSAAPPVNVAPPTTLMSPPPTPTPTSIPTPTPAPLGPLAGGGMVGDQLEGNCAYARGTLTFNSRTDVLPGLAAITGVTGADLSAPPSGTVGVGITLRGVDAYDVGFEGPQFRPADKIAAETALFDQYFQSAGFDNVELDIYRNNGPLAFASVALGFYAEPTVFCPFAIGLPVTGLPTSGTATYGGIADGIAIVGGEPRRLFGSPATLTFDYAGNTGTVRLELSGRGDAFGNFTATPASSVTLVTSTVTGVSGQFSGTAQGSPGGYSGTVMGYFLGPQANGVGMAFRLEGANGARIIGSAAFAPTGP